MSQYCPIIVALCFNFIDMITGIIGALREKSLQSSKLRDGLFKKVGFVVCYAVAWLVDNYGQYVGFKFGVLILPVIILYVCLTELVSIIENISHINPDILPDKLMSLFHISDIK